MIRISNVNYLNATPFTAGIMQFAEQYNYQLSLDIPPVCAEKLINGQADLGLVPVAKIKDIHHADIVTDYCIGAYGPVASVLLVSNEPVQHLTTVIRDRESRTSVLLASVLMKEFWSKKVIWEEEANRNLLDPGKKTGVILIGDRALRLKNQFNYQYDLAACWKDLTGLPFVFACWVANRKLDETEITGLNRSFDWGLSKREEIIYSLKNEYNGVDIRNYLFNNIRYTLDKPARKGLELFIQKAGLN